MDRVDLTVPFGGMTSLKEEGDKHLLKSIHRTNFRFIAVQAILCNKSSRTRGFYDEIAKQADGHRESDSCGLYFVFIIVEEASGLVWELFISFKIWQMVSNLFRVLKGPYMASGLVSRSGAPEGAFESQNSSLETRAFCL